MSNKKSESINPQVGDACAPLVVASKTPTNATREALRRGDVAFEGMMGDGRREEDILRYFKIIVERYPDGYVGYPLGLKGVVVGQGETFEEALADVKSAVQFHIETFGAEAFADGTRTPLTRPNHLRIKALTQNT